MQLKFALLCDAANVSKEGKLNVLGEFNTIWAADFPLVWSSCTLVFRIEGHSTEGENHTVQLKVTDADGRAAMPDSPQLPIPFKLIGPGMPIRAQAIMNLEGLRFQEPGDYSLNLLVDGRHIDRVTLFVRKRPAQPGT